MKPLTKTLSGLCLGLAAAVSLSISAFETEENNVTVRVEKVGDGEKVVNVRLNDITEAFSLPDLQPGETRFITTQSGNQITATNNENGIQLDIGGEIVSLPEVPGKLGARIHSSTPLHRNVSNSIQISGVELDDNQKQIIKDAFLAAGIDKKVNFVNKQFVFISTDEISIDGDGEHNFEFIIDGDSDSQVHTKVIKLHKESNE